jgi:hypothetical protein
MPGGERHRSSDISPEALRRTSGNPALEKSHSRSFKPFTSFRRANNAQY